MDFYTCTCVLGYAGTQCEIGKVGIELGFTYKTGSKSKCIYKMQSNICRLQSDKMHKVVEPQS